MPPQAPFARLLARVNNVDRVGADPANPFAEGVDMVRRGIRKPPDVTTEIVSKRTAPGGKNVKSRQAWKYPGGVIVRAPSIEINGRYYTDPKEHEDPGTPEKQAHPFEPGLTGTPRRKEESNFFITINPNQQFQPVDESVANHAFEKCLDHFRSNEGIVEILKFGPCNPHFLNDFANPHDLILPGISIVASVEEGEVKRRKHMHLYVTIEHYSQIQIHVQNMQKKFKTIFNANVPKHLEIKRMPYLHVKPLAQSNWQTIMRQYIHKGMSAQMQ